MAGRESLRAVLLKTNSGKMGGGGGGGGQRVANSHVGVGISGGGLTWRSLRSVSGTADTTDPQGHFFPAKLALSLGLIKFFLALLMVVLGGLALFLNAAMATLGVGLWAGAVAGLAGFLGVCASRRPYVQVYVVSFMCVAVLCIVSSGLVIILSATAWARDNHHQRAVYVDQETEQEVEVLGEVLMQRPAVLVSGALVLVGVLDCIVSLACVAVCVREACGLHSKGSQQDQGLSEGHNRKERLYRWLGQQKTIFPIGSSHGHPRGVSSISQFVPLSSSDSSFSATPRKPLSDHPTSRSSTLPSSTSHKIHKHANTTSARSHISTKTEQTSVPSTLIPSALPVISHHGSHSLPPPSTYLPVTKHPHHYPHPHHAMHHPHLPMPYPHHFPPHAPHPSLYYPNLMTPMMPTPQYTKSQEHQQTHKKKESKKHKEKKEKHEKRKSKKVKKELTDEQIERTYTGLDRELAEEFIDNTMEPGLSIQRAFSNSFEQDSF